MKKGEIYTVRSRLRCMNVRSVSEATVQRLLATKSAAAYQRMMQGGKLLYGAIAAAPVFMLRTARSIGIGDFADVVSFAKYLKQIGVRFYQSIPLNKLGINDICPYAVVSLKALEPLYLAIDRAQERWSFFRAPLAQAAIAKEKTRIADVNSSKRIDYEKTGEIKHAVIRAAFEEFYRQLEKDAGPDVEVADFRAFCRKHADWLENEYVAFMVIRDTQNSKFWKEWGEELKNPKSAAVRSLLEENRKLADYYRFEQWVVHSQWEETIRICAENGIGIIEDIPYLPGQGSSDVWANQHYYHLDYAAGAAPDQYAVKGQKWDGHPRNLEEVRKDPSLFAMPARLMAQRGTIAGRADHTWGLADPVRIAQSDNPPGDTPYNCIRYFGLDRKDYLPNARFMFEQLQGPGLIVWGEDLGVEVPCVRSLMQKMGIPRMPVMRWERRWKKESQPFVDPKRWPALSWGCSSVHDSTNLPHHLLELMSPPDHAPNKKAEEELRNEAAAFASLMEWREGMPSPSQMNDAVYASVLNRLLGGNSMLISLGIMDILGLDGHYRTSEIAAGTRINVPGTANQPATTENWNCVVPDLDEIMAVQSARALNVERVRMLLQQSGRAL